jgi:hypothetical protein
MSRAIEFPVSAVTFDVVLGHEAARTSSRLPSASTLAELYSRRADVELDRCGFYIGLANLKISVIAQGIAFRAREGGGVDSNALAAAGAVPAFAAAGLRTATEST